MKRLILLATMMVAVLASCEKHEIRNEVLTEIGFTSNVGKQTKAIAPNETYDNGAVSTYFKEQPFGVFAYGHNPVQTDLSTVMDNVPITFQDPDWKAAGDTKYYWPNDSRTTINFYAYSPYSGTATGAASENHKKLNGTVSVTTSAGLKIENYIHNMYVDFMEADHMKNQTYGTNNGVVDLNFRHKLTQLNFNISCNQYPTVNFEIQEIKLVHISNKGQYTTATGWTNLTDTTSYIVFPAKKYVAGNQDHANGADEIVNDADGNNIEDFVTVNNYGDQSSPVTLSTTPITVIPQELIVAPQPDNNGVITDNGAQYIRIKYVVSGTGVAREEVIKYVYFNGVNNTATPSTAIVWAPNKKITYNLVIGLNEIKFNPTITDWTPETSANVPVLQ